MNNTNKESIFKEIFPFYSKLNDLEKDSLDKQTFIEEFKKNDTLFDSNSECRGLIYVLEGQIRTYILSDEGKEVTLFRIRENELCVLGASCLMDTIIFDLNIEAFTNVKVLIIPTSLFKDIASKHIEAELFLYKESTNKFSEAMFSLQQILFLKIDERVATFLYDEVIASQRNTLYITQEEIAKLIGSAREVVSRVLTYLEEEDIVTLGRAKITVHMVNIKNYLKINE